MCFLQLKEKTRFMYVFTKDNLFKMKLWQNKQHIFNFFFSCTGFGAHMFPPMAPPPFLRAPGHIHYPSQDPQRMGAHSGKPSSS